MDKKTFIPLLDIFLAIILVLISCMIFMKFEQEKEHEVQSKAEYIITVSWPKDDRNDVDTWVKDPLENICWFRNKDTGLMNLDRDDLGDSNDTIFLSNGMKIEFPYNQEIVSIRNFIEGYWLLSVHMYRVHGTLPTVVDVKIDKLNPEVQTVYCKQVTLTEYWQEIIIAKFWMDSDGEFTFLNDNFEELALSVVRPGGSYGGSNQ